MADGQIVEEGRLRATHDALRQWAGRRREPWRGAMEATLFSGWIYDTLKPFAAELQMGHPAMMKAIGASKKKNDKIDARKTADLVRCNLLPECYVASAEMRELRRLLRYRNVVVAQAVRMKNKMSGLLAIGRGARPGTGVGKPQPSHLGGGTQAGCVFTGGRPEPPPRFGYQRGPDAWMQ
jgi:transposase